MKKPARKKLLALAGAAREAAGGALAGASGFRVGAAVLTAGGRTYTGCNIENPSLTMVVCAERVAMMKALSEGEREFSAIAVFAEDKEYCPPCGPCRQYLHEFAPELLVVMVGGKGYKAMWIADMLPGAFTL